MAPNRWTEGCIDDPGSKISEAQSLSRSVAFIHMVRRNARPAVDQSRRACDQSWETRSAIVDWPPDHERISFGNVPPWLQEVLTSCKGRISSLSTIHGPFKRSRIQSAF